MKKLKPLASPLCLQYPVVVLNIEGMPIASLIFFIGCLPTKKENGLSYQRFLITGTNLFKKEYERIKGGKFVF